MYLKEYRICMPLSVEEYRIGQLYMITKHCHEQSEKGEGVEVVKNEVCEHPEHGHGQYTEKRIHLSSRLPGWVQSIIPRIFYITEKAWNFYPFTITEYTCVNLSVEDLSVREVDYVDIVLDELPQKHYKEEEDLKTFQSKKTSRGPMSEGWRDSTSPIMCSYKAVKVKFEVWGLQTKVESFAHKSIRDILLLGHKQAFAWVDEWHGMTIDDIREYENLKQKETNEKVVAGLQRQSSRGSRSSSTD
ncbi:cytoplasmic phosphatidylinositol transfer protein 1-like [Haliotis rubra]|uniref:cytoplasmic phosphatidylinositol transfer protein 1-like n=1 Tax=Haliotis rubra TaxID=36100 RepID=UPI001EE4FDE3|nr:cytoplasmic phosphatidylinositol transfer protein 1-like [Haliotis rubra]